MPNLQPPGGMETSFYFSDFLEEWDFSDAKRLENLHNELQRRGIRLEEIVAGTNVDQHYDANRWGEAVASPPESEFTIEFNFNLQGHDVDPGDAHEVAKSVVRKVLEEVNEKFEDQQTKSEFVQ